MKKEFYELKEEIEEVTGVTIEEVKVKKNGCVLTGFQVKNDTAVSPVVYYNDSMLVEELASQLAKIALEPSRFNFDLEKLKNPDYFKKSLRISVSKRDGEADDVLRKKYLNFDVIMRLILSPNAEQFGSIRVTSELLKYAGLTETEAWAISEENTKATCWIESLNEVLGLPETCSLLHVASTDDKINGASVICFPEIFLDFLEHESLESVFILPSSQEELIIVPDLGLWEVEDLISMNEEVSAAEVPDLISLEPAVYYFTKKSPAEITLVSCREPN